MQKRKRKGREENRRTVVPSEFEPGAFCYAVELIALQRYRKPGHKLAWSAWNPDTELYESTV